MWVARLVAKRLFYAAISLAILALTVMVFSRISGDPAMMLLGPDASPEDLTAMRTRLGLDQPLVMQYLYYIANAVKGDFGQSIYYNESTLSLYLQRLPASLLLASAAFAWSVALGVGAGILSAVSRNRVLNGTVSLFALTGMAVPPFWVGLVLIMYLSVDKQWLPSSGSGTWQHLVMPALSLGWYFAASNMRLTRSAMLEVMDSDFVRLARLKGIPEWRVVLRHALPGALIPVVTLSAINLVLMINAAVVIETVFAWPGVGRLLYDGISYRDMPLIQAVVLISGAMVVVVSLLLDFLYVLLDPRIRHAD